MFQTIIFVGNLGKDPVMKYTPNGKAVTNFSVGVNRKYTANDGNLVTETIWFNVSAWGRQAETTNEYLHKGSRVLVEGRLRPDAATGGPRIWTGQDGTPKASFEVTASTVRFLSSKAENEALGNENTQETTVVASPEADDIPF